MPRLFGSKYDYDFWKMIVSFSMICSGRVKRVAIGPSPLSISCRFWVSVLLIAPISGAVIM